MEMKMVLNVIELAVSCQLNLHNVFVPFNDGLRSRLTDEAAFMCMCVCVWPKKQKLAAPFHTTRLGHKNSCKNCSTICNCTWANHAESASFCCFVVAVAVATTPCH